MGVAGLRTLISRMVSSFDQRQTCTPTVSTNSTLIVMMRHMLTYTITIPRSGSSDSCGRSWLDTTKSDCVIRLPTSPTKGVPCLTRQSQPSATPLHQDVAVAPRKYTELKIYTCIKGGLADPLKPSSLMSKEVMRETRDKTQDSNSPAVLRLLSADMESTIRMSGESRMASLPAISTATYPSSINKKKYEVGYVHCLTNNILIYCLLYYSICFAGAF